MYFNTVGRMNTSEEVFLEIANLDVIFLTGQRDEFRSCLIESWSHATYCATHTCATPYAELLSVYGVRVTLWLSADIKGKTMSFYPISHIPRDWFYEDNVKEMDMHCDDCRFSFDKQRMVIVDEYTNDIGVLQVNWGIKPTEFLYVLGHRPTPHEMPLNSSDETVASAKYLSIEYLLEVTQVLNVSVFSNCRMELSSTVKPILTTDKEDPKQMTTEKSITTPMSSTQMESGETTTVGTTTTTEDSNSNVITTTCVSVLPNGTATKSSFLVNIITDNTYTQEVIESIYTHLVIPKTLLGSYRRRLSSAPDRRDSSRALGAFACISISFIIGVVFLLDMSSWQRRWPTLKRNLCHA
ncbi:hypothetical protein EGW08_008953 [Elysia chlorotica]|uniref:Uncharacterized protein n=1 Tax=Elysia chlorotica TaxID=188477 RepID=A0A433TNW5_ELYCH|nr:hypothetical protein EGW08_008953 [Elysia chlorotica]